METNKNRVLIYHTPQDDKAYRKRNLQNLLVYILVITVSMSLSKLMDYFLVGKSLKYKKISTFVFTLLCVLLIYVVASSLNLEINF